METTVFLDAQKLKGVQQLVFEIATKHGWHEKPIPLTQYLGLIMTEIAEAVEADRNGRYADVETFNKRMAFVDRCFAHCNTIHKLCFKYMYKRYIKGSIEEEFADVVIRLLDMAQGLYGEYMKWSCTYPNIYEYNESDSFIETAWYFVRGTLNNEMVSISNSVAYMFAWAEHLGIDLWQQIELKIQYNDLRPYKHGGKKY